MQSTMFVRAQGADGIMTEEEVKNAPKATDNMAIKDFTREELDLSPVPKVSI